MTSGYDGWMDGWTDGWTGRQANASRKEFLKREKMEVEVKEGLSSSGPLILGSPGLTCLSRLLLVLLLQPVHEQTIPRGTQHSEELRDGKGVCVAADCREQRGVGW